MATKRPVPEGLSPLLLKAIIGRYKCQSACCHVYAIYVTMFISNNPRLLIYLVEPPEEMSKAPNLDQASCSTCKLQIQFVLT